MLRLGIVGLPNVGKSTLFNALTSSKAAAAENYPFCTVEPNVGVVEVPDPRLNRLFELVRPKKKVPAVVEFVDIAGLVRGASQGEGLGNQFLSHIREADPLRRERERGRPRRGRRSLDRPPARRRAVASRRGGDRPVLRQVRVRARGALR